jgi:hypothetical protein
VRIALATLMLVLPCAGCSPRPEGFQQEAPRGGDGASRKAPLAKKGAGLHGLKMDAPAPAVGNLVGNQIGAADNTPADEAAAAATPTRAWFPETFLFAPLIVTDAQGLATHRVKVPDRLTTWRVLALAHSRAGAQAGAETSFRGTLPTYVDPVVPTFLMSGDEVSLPIQLVNTTDEPVATTLQLAVTGAALAGAPAPVRLGAQSSQIAYALVRAGRPGPILLRATLDGKDAVERSFPVLPGGRAVIQKRSGTLASPRTLDLTLPEEGDRETASARLQVFPGALAVLRAELAAAADRGDAGSEAYALLLAGRGARLLRSLGGEPDLEALRALAIVAGQRVVRAARSSDVTTLALLTEAALAHPDNPVLARLGSRLAGTLAAGQRPDGTFAGGDGWTLQRLLVTTAECVRAVRADATSPEARQRFQRVAALASGAFGRNAVALDDPYTAAAVLASGALDGDGASAAIRDKLRARVRQAVRPDPDGARSLPVRAGTLRPDGTVPSEVEATALAALALHADASASPVVADLGTRVLAAYDPGRGFGDGRTNLAALTAVLALFAQPLPARVTITLSQDGHPLATRALEGTKLREVMILEAPLTDARGKHRYEIRAEPAVPGLGYALSLQAFVPWTRDSSQPGLELTITPPGDAHVGQPSEVRVRAAAPAGSPFTIRHALPAGVQPDEASLQALLASGAVAAFHHEDGAITLEVAALDAGATFAARYRVVPTLAGKLSTGASTISTTAARRDVPPARWLVR